MTVKSVKKGGDLIPKALSIINCNIDTSLVHNLIINIYFTHAKVSINGNSFNEIKLDNKQWDSLLELCGYVFLKDMPIRSMEIILLCDDAANFNINFLCQG